jgi:small subunit ribosomal protein S11
MAIKIATKNKKSIKKDIGEVGRVYVTATFNNTLVTITDPKGNAISSGSAGSSGFKGARKSTPYAATTAVELVAKRAMDQGIKQVEVFIKGPGNGREAALRTLKVVGLRLNSIADITPMAHNGPRPRKRRRV